MKQEADRIQKILKDSGLEHEILEHPKVYTSKEASKVRGVPLEWGVKAMLLRVGSDAFILVLIRADKKIDFSFFKKKCGSKIQFAKPAEVLKITNCEIGSVPPFGHHHPLKTFLDRDILKQEKATFNIGLHERSAVMRGKDLEKVLPKHEIF